MLASQQTATRRLATIGLHRPSAARVSARASQESRGAKVGRSGRPACSTTPPSSMRRFSLGSWAVATLALRRKGFIPFLATFEGLVVGCADLLATGLGSERRWVRIDRLTGDRLHHC